MISQNPINILLQACPDDELADLVQNLWGLLAVEIISLVGKDGYDALYSRAVFLAKKTLKESERHETSGQETPFLDVASTYTSSAAQIRDNNTQLLMVFTGLLSTLIGDQLTARLLDVAWNNLMNHRVKG